jgi:hypothetical protein
LTGNVGESLVTAPHAPRQAAGQHDARDLQGMGIVRSWTIGNHDGMDLRLSDAMLAALAWPRKSAPGKVVDSGPAASICKGERRSIHIVAAPDHAYSAPAATFAICPALATDRAYRALQRSLPWPRWPRTMATRGE